MLIETLSYLLTYSLTHSLTYSFLETVKSQADSSLFSWIDSTRLAAPEAKLNLQHWTDDDFARCIYQIRN